MLGQVSMMQVVDCLCNEVEGTVKLVLMTILASVVDMTPHLIAVVQVMLILVVWSYFYSTLSVFALSDSFFLRFSNGIEQPATNMNNYSYAYRIKIDIL